VLLQRFRVVENFVSYLYVPTLRRVCIPRNTNDSGIVLVHDANVWQNFFISCHRKYSQSKRKKAIQLWHSHLFRTKCFYLLRCNEFSLIPRAKQYQLHKPKCRRPHYIKFPWSPGNVCPKRKCVS